MEPNIEVAVRIRPPIHSNHLVEDICLYADPYTKEIILANQMSFYVDYALPLEINQSQLFDSIILPRIDYMLQGYNVSFIAYGHVNSGKTYSILGPGLHCALSETTYGILPRSGREIFNKLLAFRQQFGLQFKVFVSFIEICNEEPKDLLASNNVQFGNNNNISFKTNERGLTVLCGIEEVECHNVSELFNCLRLGMSYRKTARTNLNSASSLSHCVVIIKVEQRWLSNQGQLETIISQAMFVDLAGNEQMFLMSPIDSNPVQQTTVGNMGLGVISAIIASFSGQWLPSSPFTQSLLFPLLKDSFIGSIKTLLICCLSPSSTDYSETLNSLRLIDHIHTLNKYSFVRETIKFSANNVNNDYKNIDNSEEGNNSIKGREINGNGNANGDPFGLEFAASQWLKLVANAEGLFNKLVTNDMPEDAREQIEEWLCLKQECEECFGLESRAGNVQNHTGRSLERIEEVTETDTKSKSGRSSDDSDSDGIATETDSVEGEIDDNENNGSDNINGQDEDNDYGEDDGEDDGEEEDDDDDDYGGGNANGDEDDYLDNDKSRNCNKRAVEQELFYSSHGVDFVEKLDQLMDQFRFATDKTIGNIINKVSKKELPDDKDVSFFKPLPNTRSNGRRKSILPGENQFCLSNLSLNPEENVIDDDISSFKKKTNDEDCTDKNSINDKLEENGDIVLVLDISSITKQTKFTVEPEKEFRLLSANNDIKQSQLGLANLDLEAASKRIDELQSMIKIKEQFIEEMIKNSGARISAKAKFQRKHTRLEEEYFKARTQLAKAEKALNHEEGNPNLENEVQKYKTLAAQYEKRLQDIEMIKQIAGDSAKKVLELENSLHNSKRKMQKLKKQLKKEEEHKYCLEKELMEDQKRIKQLEEKYKLQSDKLKSKTNEDSDDTGNEEKRLKWIAEEEERLMNLQLSSQKLQEQLQEKQTMLERRESFLKEKLSEEKSMSKSLLHVSARISHLEQILKEKSTNLEQADDLDTKEALRHEIRNLRKTRDCLVEQRRNLDAKFNKDKVLTTVEERKFLECDEAIEAIDATIEYKNELMCGRKGLVGEVENGEREKGEEMLLARLMKLSPMEMRILLYKYFQKVIDLRESGRKMETQIAELDRQAETQAWKIQALSNALQQAHLESERRLIAAQKEHQEKLHLIFRHFADESSGHSSGADNVEKCCRQNKALKQRVLELEAMLYKARNSQYSRGASNSNAQETEQATPTTQLNIPQHNLKQLQGGSSSHTTKVTRQKNKLIIQQQKTKKK
ncbi:kinesin-like protein costa [Lycorma delicatula]|uniref:kinesin-like protein costa n=1 Tax=Lycorma delicatula TaxID=130591 RepID=UPI003F51771C